VTDTPPAPPCKGGEKYGYRRFSYTKLNIMIRFIISERPSHNLLAEYDKLQLNRTIIDRA
jgi:hypothetical protein